MPRPDLSELSTDDLFEYVRQNPGLARAIAESDPRVKLMEEFYADPDAKADLQKHGKRLHPKASVPEIDIPAKMEAALEPDRKKIAALEKELEGFKTNDKRKAFRAQLVEDGADDKDLDAIETFMVENEFGPKASKRAVAAFYETKESKEPNYQPDSVFTMPDGGGAEHIKALLAASPADDLDDINAPFVEKIVREEFGSRPRGTRPAMA